MDFNTYKKRTRYDTKSNEDQLYYAESYFDNFVAGSYNNSTEEDKAKADFLAKNVKGAPAKKRRVAGGRKDLYPTGGSQTGSLLDLWNSEYSQDLKDTIGASTPSFVGDTLGKVSGAIDASAEFAGGVLKEWKEGYDRRIDKVGRDLDEFGDDIEKGAGKVFDAMPDAVKPLLNQWKEDYSQIGYGIQESAPVEFAQNILSGGVKQPVSQRPDPKNMIQNIFRTTGAMSGEVVMVGLTRSLPAGMAVSGMMNAYNQVKREGRDYGTADIPETLLEGAKGYGKGLAFKTGSAIGGLAGRGIATQLKKLPFMKNVDINKVAEGIGMAITRPAMDTALLTGTAVAQGEEITPDMLVENLIFSWMMEAYGSYTGSITRNKKFEPTKDKEAYIKEKLSGKLLPDVVSAKGARKGVDTALGYLGIKRTPAEDLPDMYKQVMEVLEKTGLHGETINKVILDNPQLKASDRIELVKLVQKPMPKEIEMNYNRKLPPEENINLKKAEYEKFKRAMQNDKKFTREQRDRAIATENDKFENFKSRVNEEFRDRAVIKHIPFVNGEAFIIMEAGKPKEAQWTKKIDLNVSREVEKAQGKPYFEVVLVPMRNANHIYETQLKEATDNRKKIHKDYSKKEQERVARYRFGNQGFVDEAGEFIHTGRETLEANGKKYLEYKDLTKNEKKLVDIDEAYYKKMIVRINETNKMVGKKELKPLEMDEGSYYPIFRRMGLAEARGEIDTDFNNKFFMKNSNIGLKHAQKRGYSKRDADYDLMGSFERYTNSALKYINLAPEIARIERYMKPFRVPEHMTKQVEKFGKTYDMKKENPEGYKIMRRLLDTYKGIEGSEFRNKHPKLENFMRTMSENTSVSLLGFYANSMIAQHGALDGTLTEFGSKYAMKGAEAILDPVRMKHMYKESREISTRVHDANISQVGAKTRNKAGKKVKQASFAGLKYMDLWSSAITWQSAHQYAHDKLGYTGRKAVNYADQAVIRIQGSAKTIDTAPVQNTTRGKFATVFNTFVINRFNYLKHDLLGKGGRDMIEPMLFGKPIKNKTAQRTINMSRYLASSVAMNLAYRELGDNEYYKFGAPNPTPFVTLAESLQEAFDREDAGGEAIAEGDVVKAIGKSLVEALKYVPVVGGSASFGGTGLGGANFKVIADLVDDINLDNAKSTRNLQGVMVALGRIGGIAGTQQVNRLLWENRRRFLEGRKEKRAEKRLKRQNSIGAIMKRASGSNIYKLSGSKEEEPDWLERFLGEY